jgi:hypothetical protein
LLNPFRLPRGWVPRSRVRVEARISAERFRSAENLCCPKAHALGKTVSPLKGLYTVEGYHLFGPEPLVMLTPAPGSVSDGESIPTKTLSSRPTASARVEGPAVPHSRKIISSCPFYACFWRRTGDRISSQLMAQSFLTR